MNIYFGQIYIEPNATFPFSHDFQLLLSRRLTALVSASPEFISKYGAEWNLIFRISAKTKVQISEVRGPTVFRKDQDVEYTIFLPFDTIQDKANPNRAALTHIVNETCIVLESSGISVSGVRKQQPDLVKEILSTPDMFEPNHALNADH